MTKMQFVTAAKRAAEADSGEDYLEFTLADQEFKATLPTPGQAAYLGVVFTSGSMAEVLAGALDMLDGLLEGDGGRRIRKLLLMGALTPELLLWGDENNEKGILGTLIELAAAGRPTTPPSDSSPSQANGGRKSTGRSPGKGSTLTDSPSTGS